MADGDVSIDFGDSQRLEYMHVYRIAGRGAEYALEAATDRDVVVALVGEVEASYGHVVVPVAVGGRVEISGGTSYVLRSVGDEEATVQVFGLVDESLPSS